MTGDLRNFVEGLLLVLATLLPIVNPFGGAPVFLAMTADCTAPLRATLAQKIAVNAFILLLALALHRRVRPRFLRALGADRPGGRRPRRLRERVGPAAGGKRDAGPPDRNAQRRRDRHAGRSTR